MGFDITGNDGAREYRIRHEVVTSGSPSVDTYRDILAALKLIGFYEGAVLLIDPAAFCQRLSIRIARENVKVGANGGTGLWYWQADSTFATRSGTDPEASRQSDPTKRPPKFSMRLARYTLPSTVDASRQPVVNSAGDPFRRDVPTTRFQINIERTVKVFDPDHCLDAKRKSKGLTFSRNEKVWSPFKRYSAQINDWDVAPGTGLVNDLNMNFVFENNETLLEVNLEILVDEDEHKDVVFDRGWRAWPDLATKNSGVPPREIIDGPTGMRPSEGGHFLDGNGLKLPKTAGPVQLRFQYFPQKDWSPLDVLVT